MKLNDLKYSKCDYTTVLKKNLEHHVTIIHSNIKVVKRKRKLEKHKKSDGKLNCEQCSYKAYKKSAISRHVKAVHDKIKDWECAHCNFNFAHKATLLRHIKAVHERIKRFSCDDCGFKTAQSAHSDKTCECCTQTHQKLDLQRM